MIIGNEFIEVFAEEARKLDGIEFDVLPVNRTMKKYKICVTIILNFLIVIF